MMKKQTVAAALFDLVQAPLRWQLVKTGFDLDVFDRLSEPARAQDFAHSLSMDARKVSLFLDALCAMGLLEKDAGRYAVAPEAAPYVLTSSPSSLRAMLINLADLRHGDIGALLREELDSARLDLSDPAFWDRAAASLRSFHRGMAAHAMVDLLESLPEWPNARHLLDLGAGSEILSLLVTERRPDLRVTILDLPPLATRIRAAVEQAGGFGGRISILSGDYNEIALGDGYDVIWASMTLYYARDLESVLAKIRRALAPGGIFLSLHECLSAERTRPEAHVVGRLIPALRGQDRSFSQGQIAAALGRAGFSRVESRMVETSFGPFVLDIGRCAL